MLSAARAISSELWFVPQQGQPYDVMSSSDSGAAGRARRAFLEGLPLCWEASAASLAADRLEGQSMGENTIVEDRPNVGSGSSIHERRDRIGDRSKVVGCGVD